jgi:hypothetical protein
MKKKQDKCMHINDIEQIVNKRIEETSVDSWMYVLKDAIRGEIYSYWHNEMGKSKHMNYGYGYVYVGDPHGITCYPDASSINRQTEEVIKLLFEKKGIKL